MPPRQLLAKVREALKQRIYHDTYVGGCHIASRWIEIHYGFRQVKGCYVYRDGIHADHCWNVLPDGRILDATAEQFNRFANFEKRIGGIYGVFIGRPNRKYRQDCGCRNKANYNQIYRNSRKMKTVRLDVTELLGT